MKAKLTSALNSNVDPFFFALACTVLFSVCMTATALAEDVLAAVDDPPGTVMVMATDGQVMWHPE